MLNVEEIHGKELQLLIYTLMRQWDKTETTSSPVLCLICIVLIYVIIFLQIVSTFTKLEPIPISLLHKNGQLEHGTLSKENKHTNTLHTIYNRNNIFRLNEPHEMLC
jgi:hypothetical protein